MDVTNLKHLKKSVQTVAFFVLELF